MKVKMFMLAGLAFVLIGLGIGSSVAQAPSWEWAKTFGGRKNDLGFSMQQTRDGGFILLGWTESFGAGGRDFWLIKTDANGNKEWDRTFGGHSSDVGYSVQQTSDGGFILLGYTWSFGAGESDIWLIKTDANGNKQWEKTFGGRDSDVGYFVQQTSDGGFILLGTTWSFGTGLDDIWLIKTDGDGNKLWEKTFDKSDIDRGFSVQQTRDGGYIFLGATRPFALGWPDFWLIKTDANGNMQWDRTFGGRDWDWGHSVQQTSDGGFILLGQTESFGAGESDIWLIKTDANGNKEWDRTFGGHSSDVGHSVQQTSDGGFILLGYTWSFGAGESDIWLIKTDANGNKQWEKTFGGDSIDVGQSVQQTSDGDFILLGYTSSFGAGLTDFWLIKYRP